MKRRALRPPFLFVLLPALLGQPVQIGKAVAAQCLDHRILRLDNALLFHAECSHQCYGNRQQDGNSMTAESDNTTAWRTLVCNEWHMW